MSYPNTPIVFTNTQVQGNRFNYCPLGMALLSGGLIQIVQINGVGLVTGGLVWQGPEIWFHPQEAAPITTGWTAAIGYAGSATVITTGWSSAAGYSGCVAASLIATTWSNSQSFGSEFYF